MASLRSMRPLLIRLIVMKPSSLKLIIALEVLKCLQQNPLVILLNQTQKVKVARLSLVKYMYHCPLLLREQSNMSLELQAIMKRFRVLKMNLIQSFILKLEILKMKVYSQLDILRSMKLQMVDSLIFPILQIKSLSMFLFLKSLERIESLFLARVLETE